MEQPLHLKPGDRGRLIGIAVVLGTVLILYLAFSVARYEQMAGRSVIKGNVLMRVIQHGVKSVCPRCGTKGIPSCPNCQVEMYWNGYQGKFICAACGQGGFPHCPRCKHFMTWIESK